MPTQTSQLVSNLQNIYSEKLLIKQAIPTTSDDFMMYHTYISNLHPSGTSYISANGLSDVSSYQFAYVTVEGSGSGDFDGYDYYTSSAYTLQDIVDDSSLLDTELNYYQSCITSDFTFEEDNQTLVSYFTWIDDNNEVFIDNEPYTYTCYVTVYDDDFRGNYQDIAQAFNSYSSDLENMIYPVLQNVTVSESSNPAEDGYDYLIEGKLYSINLMNASGPVMEITENGFYPNTSDNCYFGFNVNVSGGSGGSGDDPVYDALSMSDVIEQGLTTAKYVYVPIDDNFEYRGTQTAPYAMWDANITYWDENLDDNVDALVIVSIDANNTSVLSDNGARLATAFTNYPDLYGTVMPVLEDVTIEFVQKSSGNYYSVTGGIHYLTMPKSVASVDVITQNGDYPTQEGIGVHVAVPQGAIVPKANIGSLDNVAANPETPRNIIISTSSSNWVDTGDFETDNLIQNSDVYNYIQNMSDNSFICEIDETDSNNNHYYILTDSQGYEDPDWFLVEMTECGIVNDSRLGHYAYILNGSVTNFRDI